MATSIPLRIRLKRLLADGYFDLILVAQQYFIDQGMS